jgi:hypothetical protein
MLYLFVFLSFFSQVSFANCRNINLYETQAESMDKIPVYDQDGAGICYSYVASQLINYHLLKNKLASELVVHPVWGAVMASMMNNKTSTASGHSLDVLRGLKKNFNCDYNTVKDSILDHTKANGVTEPVILSFIEKFVENYNLEKIKFRIDTYLKPRIDDTNIRKKSLLTVQNLGDQNFEIAFKLTSKQMKNFCSSGDFDYLLPALKESDMTMSSIWFNVLFKKCNELQKFNIQNKQIKSLEIKNMLRNEEMSDANILEKINENLKSQRPLVINYCSKVIKNKQVRLTENINKNFRKQLAGCNSHASLIVASKKSGNSCQYLIKNTWGSWYWAGNNSCYCQHKKTKKKIDNCSKKTHPESDYTVLGCWFDGQDLAPNVQDAMFIP